MKTKYNIKTINPKSIDEIRQIIKDSLNVILEDNGLVLDFGNATYDSDTVKFTNFKVRLADADTEVMKNLKHENEIRGYRDEEPFSIDKQGNMNGEWYTLVGYNPRARKMPFIVERVHDKQQYKIEYQTAVRMFASSKIEKEWEKKTGRTHPNNRIGGV